MALLEKASGLADMRLQTDRLVLRRPCAADIDRLVDLLGEYEVTKWLAKVPWPYRRDDAEDFLQRAGTEASDLNLVIDGGEGLIGGIGLAGLGGRPSIGYWLGTPYWGRGLMSEAVEALLVFAFDQLNVGEVVASVFDHNVASRRLQERFGFKITGRNLDFSLARGNAVPSVTTALSRDDFETFREPATDHSLIVDGF